jgi:hypothetical protein
MNFDQLNTVVHGCAELIEKVDGIKLSNTEKYALNDKLKEFLSDIEREVVEEVGSIPEEV